MKRGGTWTREGFPEMVSMGDIATRFGVSAPAVNHWRRRHEGFPEPVAVVGNGNNPVYLWTEVTSWYEAHDRLRREREALREARRSDSE